MRSWQQSQNWSHSPIEFWISKFTNAVPNLCVPCNRADFGIQEVRDQLLNCIVRDDRVGIDAYKNLFVLVDVLQSEVQGFGFS